MSTSSIFSKRLSLAVKESITEVQEEARATHVFESRTGTLEKAIETRFKSDGLVGEVYLDTNVAPYAKFVHEGTKAHSIFPKNKRSLRFVSNGRFAFTKHVMHPGTKKDQFLYEAFEKTRPTVVSIFKKHTKKSIEEVTRGIRGGGLSREFIWK